MTTPREETKADEDKPRFVGPFVRLTRALKDGKRDDLWVRFADVLSVTSPAEWQCAHKGAQTCVALLGTQDFVTEPPALVLGLLAEALEKAGRDEHWRVEQQIAALAKSVVPQARGDEAEDLSEAHYDLVNACQSVLDAAGYDTPEGHVDACDKLRRLASDLPGVLWSGEKTALLGHVKRLEEALRDIRLAIHAHGRDVQALVTVEMILESLSGDVRFIDREGLPIDPKAPNQGSQVQR